MKKLMIAAAALTGVVFMTRRCASGGIDFEQMIERMPENAPPKWIFRNITEIRCNTERILQMLDAERAPTPIEPARHAA